MAMTLHDALRWWNHGAFYYLLAINTSYLVLMVAAFRLLRRHLRLSRLVDERLLFRSAALLKPVSILAPAFNEELSVVDNVRSLLNLNYPHHEVILVNDGSRDGTLEALRTAYDLEETVRAPVGDLPTQPVRAVYRAPHHPNLLVVDKANGGKFDALNAGVNYARCPLFLAIDTDSLLERDVLLKLVRPFLERPETVAVGGLVRAVNGCDVRGGRVVRVGLPRNPLVLWQIVEYVRAFLFGRIGWAGADMLLVVSGAFGMFQRDAVLAAGGYRHTVGEDMELVLRLHRTLRERGRPYRVAFLPDPVCWTEVPETPGVLGRQRNRWSRGLMESLWMHRAMLGRPRYGRIGLVALPYFLLVEALGGFVELIGYATVATAWWLGAAELSFVLAFLAVSMLFSSALSLGALAGEELTLRPYPRLRHLLVLGLFGLLEGLGYHQLSLWWRVRGVVDFLRGKHGWGTITRRGFGRPTG